MEANLEQQVTKKDILKHYLSSLVIYGIILVFIIVCPVYNQTISNENFDYTAFFFLYYLAYLIIAPIIFFTLKPKSILTSRNIAIWNYIKRQFEGNKKTEDYLKNIEPKEDEKQAFMILFMKTFFGVFSVNILCNNYLANPAYTIDFIKTLFIQSQIDNMGAGMTFASIAQFIIDTGDVWLKLIFAITTIILAFSYLTELDLFKNKIKSIDTTPLGVLSCIACYYPITILTERVFQVTSDSALNVDNQLLLLVLIILAILVNIGILISVIKLGTKSGNLTNRGIVTGFPYNIVRHPNYALYITYIIITTVPLMVANITGFEKFMMLGATLIWIYIYYLRAITEERHLIKDPEYQAYVEKVKYRFIPKLF